jgi:hypothetical protein
VRSRRERKREAGVRRGEEEWGGESVKEIDPMS